MPDDDTASNVSTATARGGVLRSGDFKDGMVCRANHSVKHAIVTALHSVLPPELKTADSLLQRDADILPDLQGKYRPLVVLEKPRGRTPARIVLTTRFNKQPVQETDAVAQMLAVPLGNATPPWPANDSPRIRVTPEWTDPHSYVLAFAFFLQNGRGPKRFRKGGVEYKVEDPELEVIRRLCKARIEAMAAMSPEELDALKSSYEAHVASRRPTASSYIGSTFTAALSQVSVLPSIREDGPGTPRTSIAEVDEDGFITPKRKRRSGSAISRQSAGRS